MITGGWIMKKCTNIFKSLFSTILIGTVAFSVCFYVECRKGLAEADTAGLEDDSIGSWERQRWLMNLEMLQVNRYKIGCIGNFQQHGDG